MLGRKKTNMINVYSRRHIRSDATPHEVIDAYVSKITGYKCLLLKPRDGPKCGMYLETLYQFNKKEDIDGIYDAIVEQDEEALMFYELST